MCCSACSGLILQYYQNITLFSNIPPWIMKFSTRKYLNFFPLSLPSSLPSSLLRCISFPHHPSVVLWIRLPLPKKKLFEKSFGIWKWYTDIYRYIHRFCSRKYLKNIRHTMNTIPISPPTCAIDHHCEVHCSSMPSEGADLFKHVRLLVVSSAENLHLVKSSTQPAWGLSFPPKVILKTKKNTQIRCEPIIFWIKEKTETTETTNFSNSLLSRCFTSPINPNLSMKKELRRPDMVWTVTSMELPMPGISSIVGGYAILVPATGKVPSLHLDIEPIHCGERTNQPANISSIIYIDPLVGIKVLWHCYGTAMICIGPSNSKSSDTNHETRIQSQEPDLSGDGPGENSLFEKYLWWGSQWLQGLQNNWIKKISSILKYIKMCQPFWVWAFEEQFSFLSCKFCLQIPEIWESHNMFCASLHAFAGQLLTLNGIAPSLSQNWGCHN